jgi:probable HAF family extracellular repeat protein
MRFPCSPRLETLEDRCLLSAYRVIDIGFLGSGRNQYSVSFDLTEDLTVVGGSADDTRHVVPFVGTPGQLHPLPIFSVWGGEADAVNATGAAVGFLVGGGFVDHAVLWKSQDEVTDLGTLPGGNGSAARDIDSAGDVVGVSGNDLGNARAFLYPAGGTGMQDLGTLDGGTSSYAFAINNQGQVVGRSNTGNADVNYLAFLYSDGTMSSLGSFDGRSSEAHDVNDEGIAVGMGMVPGGIDYHAARFQSGTTPIDLGTLPGGTSSSAQGINNLGQIVGYSFTTQIDGAHAFLWTDATGMLDLNDLIQSNSGWTLRGATAIDDQGDITGYGVNPQGIDAGFILVPEGGLIRVPSTRFVMVPSSLLVADLTAHSLPAPPTLALPVAEPGGLTAPGDTLYVAAPAANANTGTNPLAAGIPGLDDTGAPTIRDGRVIGTYGDGTEADVVLGTADQLPGGLPLIFTGNSHPAR